jgi:2-iminobutanoate/2-iminopropanoate deaminase
MHWFTSNKLRIKKFTKKYVTTTYPRRTALDLPGAMEGTGLRRNTPRRHDIRFCLPAFRSSYGRDNQAPIERQTELVLQQLKLCVETAGSSLEKVLKCNVYCTKVDKFAIVNEIYVRFFPKDPPARIFVNVPAWPGHFDIEIDCIAAV